MLLCFSLARSCDFYVHLPFMVCMILPSTCIVIFISALQLWQCPVLHINWLDFCVSSCSYLLLEYWKFEVRLKQWLVWCSQSNGSKSSSSSRYFHWTGNLDCVKISFWQCPKCEKWNENVEKIEWSQTCLSGYLQTVIHNLLSKALYFFKETIKILDARSKPKTMTVCYRAEFQTRKKYKSEDQDW